MHRFLPYCFILFMLVSCGGNGSKSTDPAKNAETIYKKYCILCHGSDGKLGLNGAKDLTVSTLSEAERIVLISEGKNTMTPFKAILTPEEIQAVAKFTMTLK